MVLRDASCQKCLLLFAPLVFLSIDETFDNSGGKVLETMHARLIAVSVTCHVAQIAQVLINEAREGEKLLNTTSRVYQFINKYTSKHSL